MSAQRPSVRSAALVGALALVAIATACTSAPLADRASNQVQRSSSAPSIDLAEFASNLSASVAGQNVSGYGAAAYTRGVSAGGTSSTPADPPSDATEEPSTARATAFAAALTAEAARAYSAQVDLFADSKKSLASGDAVTRVDVSVESVSAATLSSQPGETVVTSNLYIARTLESGIVWEEVVPYVSTVDDATGAVTRIDVQDDSSSVD